MQAWRQLNLLSSRMMMLYLMHGNIFQGCIEKLHSWSIFFRCGIHVYKADSESFHALPISGHSCV